MHFRTSLTATAAALLVILNVASPQTLIDDGTLEVDSSETERIVGGKDAEPGMFPWSVALYYLGYFICTASIISPTTVLTAAHCVVFGGQTQDPDLFYGVANVNRSASEVRIEFQSVRPHENYYDGSPHNDIAVLKTVEAIPFDKKVRPVCIARRNTPMKMYKKATAMGWGFTSPRSDETPDILQYAAQRITPNTLCGIFTPGVDSDKMCAKGFLSGICNGDSGGPLVHVRGKKPPVQIGIASYVNGRSWCGGFLSGVWTRVSSYYDFIMQASEDWASICTV